MRKGIIISLLAALLLAVVVPLAIYGQAESCTVLVTVSGSGVFQDRWSSDGCDSEVAGRGHARYYRFTLTQAADISIVLESTDADTYLYLREGEATSGAFLYENDDDGGTNRSRIDAGLSAGTYTIEATTFGPGETGSFSLTLSGFPRTATPQPTPQPTIRPTVTTVPAATVTPPSAPASRLSLSSANDQVCVLRDTGLVDCEAVDTGGRTGPPAGMRFTHLASGDNHTCGLREEGDVICWGAGTHAHQPTPTPAAPHTPTPIPTQAPTPQPTPGPTQTPGGPVQTNPSAPGGLGSRGNPVSFGTTVEVRNSDTDHWEITVLGVDPIADSEVARQNLFNDPPEEGNRFFLVRARVKYLGPNSARWRDSRFEATGASGVVYGVSQSCGVIPFDFEFLPELFTGGTAEGNVCWEIASTDAASLVMFLEPDSFFGGGPRNWFSLDTQGWAASYSENRNNLSWRGVAKLTTQTGGNVDFSVLGVDCFDSTELGRYPSVTVVWSDVVSTRDGLPVRLTWDNQPPVNSSWDTTGTGLSTFPAYDPNFTEDKQIIENLSMHQQLRVEVQGDSGWVSATFNLAGFETAHGHVAEYCAAGQTVTTSDVDLGEVQRLHEQALEAVEVER